MNAADVRRSYIEFFTQKHAHTFVPSSPVVPIDDPTLLFTNAGMNQFKPIFLGQEQRGYTRAVNTQKCIRAGGKHNDLDDVGKDSYHHTFFEMLGNWSFGDYFKAEAIDWAWELLTLVWKIDPARLHATYFEGDPAEHLEPDLEARDLWLKHLPAERVHPGNKKDNFWEMGDTGPCGPCSEIHFDRSPDLTGGPLVNADAQDTVVEIWNLVFIQYNRQPGGKLVPLPAKHVDTGMGFERIVRVLQGKADNYSTDLWAPLFEKLGELSCQSYGGQFATSRGTGVGHVHNPSDTDVAHVPEARATDEAVQRDIAFRAIADHARMASFAITDGALPGNKGRNSVLRSVIRRAVRFGYQTLGITQPFVHELVPTIVQTMGDAFPELRGKQAMVQQTIKEEETDFLRTVERGLKIFESAVEGSRGTGVPHLHNSAQSEGAHVPEARATAEGKLSGKDAFDLHATYGFPIDLTRQLAEERGLTVDLAEYEQAWAEHQKVSGKGRKTAGDVAVDLSPFRVTDDSPKYAGRTTEASVLGWIIGSESFGGGDAASAEDHASAGAREAAAGTSVRLKEGDEAYLLLDRTTFYAEQGGQVGDVGSITTATGKFLVVDTERRGKHVLHWGQVDEGYLLPHQRAMVDVDLRRSDIMRNHTGTHLLNLALRRVLGDGIEQRGSLVDHEKLRFDFSHSAAVSMQELEQVERIVNEQVRMNLPVQAVELPLADAQQIKGVRAVFGEKYPDPVRVIAVAEGDVRSLDAADYSIEFCGGTHLSQSGEIGFFRIVAEESVSKGIRRITAVTGSGAISSTQRTSSQVSELSRLLSVPSDQVVDRVKALMEENKTLKKRPKAPALGTAGAAGGLTVDDLLKSAEGPVIVADAGAMDADAMRTLIDGIKAKQPSYAVLLASTDGEKVTLIAGVSDDLIKQGLKAGDWVKAAAQACGGSGGGKPNLAQAGGKEPAKIPDALAVAKDIAKAKL